MSTAPWGMDPKVPDHAASADKVLDVTLFSSRAQEDIIREQSYT